MSVLKHDAFLREHPVFTGDELAAHLARIGSNGVRAQEKALEYCTRAGRLRRVRQGMYAVIPPGADGDTYPVDPYLVAAKLTPDAVLSHHTALEFHGRANSVRQRFIYSAERPVETLTFRDQVFRGTRFPRALVRSGTEYHGVLTVERLGMLLRVASLERTLVDVLHRPDLAGGWEEVSSSLEVVERFNLDEVVSCALLLDSATTAARVGFFLEQDRETLMVEDDQLKALRQRCPRQPHYLDRSRRRGGKLAAQWNLVVPEEVLTRSVENGRPIARIPADDDPAVTHAPPPAWAAPK